MLISFFDSYFRSFEKFVRMQSAVALRKSELSPWRIGAIPNSQKLVQVEEAFSFACLFSVTVILVGYDSSATLKLAQ
jgi:hypothetical protein